MTLDCPSFGQSLAACLAVLVTGCGDNDRAELVVTLSADGAPAAGRIVLFDAAGQQVRNGTLDLYNQRQGGSACRIGPQVIASWGGLVVGPASARSPIPVGTGACAIPPGRYRVWAWQGFEYERWEGELDIAASGRTSLAIPLARAFDARGMIAADFHVHAHASNDSGMPDEQRVLAQIASGLDVGALANHNVYGDLDAAIATLGFGDIYTSIASSELTSEALHVGAYPVPTDAPPAPSETLVKAGAAELFAIARAMPTRPIVQVNHPRFRYGALFDLTRWDGVAWPPPFPLEFDAIEVIAGYSAFNLEGDRRIDDGVRDLYTLTEHGKLVAALGNSDTHDFNWVLDGTARTYLHATRDEASVIAAIRARRTQATTCPLLVVTANGAGPGETATATNGSVHVVVDVRQAAWCGATTTKIVVGNTLHATAGTHWEGDLPITSPTWIGVTVEGPTTLPLEMTGTYQRDKWQHPGITPYAVISPILVE